MKTATMATITLDGEYRVIYHFDTHDFQIVHKYYDTQKGRFTRQTVGRRDTLSHALMVITATAARMGR